MQESITAFLTGRLQLQADCRLFDHSGKPLRAFPFGQCLFLPDGRMVAFDDNLDLTLFDAQMQRIWSLPGNPHHQLTLNAAKDTIYFCSADIASYKGKQTRFDSVYAVGLDGKIRGRWHLKDHWQEIKKKLQIKEDIFWEVLPSERLKTEDREISHLNSVQEIPPNPLANTDPAYRQGNVLVNFFGPHRLSVILSPDLSTLLQIAQSPYDQHDMKITPDGMLLSFVNRDGSTGKKSWLEKRDPLGKRERWTIEPPFFFNPSWGSVQELDGGKYLAYTDNSKATHANVLIVNLAREVEWRKKIYPNNPSKQAKHGRFSVFQIRIGDFSEFLRRNQSP